MMIKNIIATVLVSLASGSAFCGIPGASRLGSLTDNDWVITDGYASATNAITDTYIESLGFRKGGSAGVATNEVRDIVDASFAGGTQDVNRVIGSFDNTSNRVANIESRTNVWNAAVGIDGVREVIDSSFVGGTQEVNRAIGSFDNLSNRVEDIESRTNEWNSAIQEESDPTVQLTNGVIDVRGETIRPLTEHQPLTNYYNRATIDEKLLGKADAVDITADKKCKISYNKQGLVTGGEDLSANDIPSIDASKITSGVFDSNRIPGLPTTKITEGTFPDARIASASVWNAKPTKTDLSNATNNVLKEANTVSKRLADNIAVVGNGYLDGYPYCAQGTSNVLFRAIGFGGGAWVAGSNDGRLWRSVSGTNDWSVVLEDGAFGIENNYARAIKWREGAWIALYSQGLAYTSDDGGITWVRKDMRSYGEVYDICYSPFSAEVYVATDHGVLRTEFDFDEFVTVSSQNARQVSCSDDGTIVFGSATSDKGLMYVLPGELNEHISNVTSSNFRCIGYYNGMFIAGAYNYGRKDMLNLAAPYHEDTCGIWYSYDGKEWRRAEDIAEPFYSATYSDGIWVATCTYSGHVWYSLDGEKWVMCDRIGDVSIPSTANGDGLTLFARLEEPGGIYVAKIGRYVKSNWFYSKDEVDKKLASMSPEPGNYSSVSNAAMWASNNVDEVKAELNDKVSRSGDTMTGNLSVSGTVAATEGYVFDKDNVAMWYGKEDGTTNYVFRYIPSAYDTGIFSVEAFGGHIATTSLCATAIGYGASAIRSYSTALGDRADATGEFSTALGCKAKAYGDSSIALGFNATATNDYSFVASTSGYGSHGNHTINFGHTDNPDSVYFKEKTLTRIIQDVVKKELEKGFKIIQKDDGFYLISITEEK